MRSIFTAASIFSLFLAGACANEGTISIAAYLPATANANAPNDNVFSQGETVRVQVMRNGKVKKDEVFTIGDKSGELGIVAFKGTAQVKLTVESEDGSVIGKGATALLDLEEDDDGSEIGILVAAVNSFVPTTKREDTTVSAMEFSRVGLTATEIAGGRVVLAGGTELDESTGAVLAGKIRDDIEVYDPSTGSYAKLASKLSAPRAFHTATKLPDGRVIFIGGLTLSGGAISTLITADVFDPATCGRPFDAALCKVEPIGGGARLLAPRAGHTATLLQDGSILLAGGFSQINSPVKAFIDSVEVLAMGSGNTGTFSLQGQLSERRGFAAAVLMSNGKVLITGGRDETNIFASTDVFTPGVGVIPGPQMFTARFSHTATAIGPNADVFVMVGGFANAQANQAVAIIDAIDSALNVFPGPFAINPPDVGPITEHSAMRLSDGKVLVCGGSKGNGDTIDRAFTLEFKSSPVPILVPGSVDALEFPRAKATGLSHSSGQAMIFGGASKTTDPNNGAETFTTLPNGEIFFSAE